MFIVIRLITTSTITAIVYEFHLDFTSGYGVENQCIPSINLQMKLGAYQ